MECQVCDATTKNARRAISVRTLGNYTIFVINKNNRSVTIVQRYFKHKKFSSNNGNRYEFQFTFLSPPPGMWSK